MSLKNQTKKIRENIENNNIYESLLELKIIASNNNFNEVVNWCNKEMDGYLEEDKVPIYREADSNIWKIRFAIEGFPKELAKFCPVFLEDNYEQNKVIFLSENIVTISDIIRMNNDFDVIEDKKNLSIVIEDIKNKKLFCRTGLKDLEKYIENRTIIANDRSLDFIANFIIFDTSNGHVNPNVRQFIVDKDILYNKIIEGIKSKIIYELEYILATIAKEKKSEYSNSLQNKIDFGDNNKFIGAININQHNIESENKNKNNNNNNNIYHIVIIITSITTAVYYILEIVS